MSDWTLPFPPGFWWGTATAGHQVEGDNVHSDWWAWEQLGRTHDGSRSGRACDYWNRYAQDHAWIAAQGHTGLRLGVEWARVEPEEGRFDEAALARYRAILEDLRARGLRVCLTLNHWVLPRWFAQQGGWRGQQAMQRWERYLRRVIPALGDQVDLWITLNEPMVPVIVGHLIGYFPPCKVAPLQAAAVFRRLLRAHAIAYGLIHELAPRAPDGGPAQAGWAGAVQHVEPFHQEGWKRAIEGPLARAFARASFRAWDDSVAEGRALPPYGLGERVPDLKGSLDFVGLNYYMRVSVRLGWATPSNVAAGGFPIPEGIDRTDMGWQIYPPGFYHALRETHERFGKPIYVTENGCAADDALRRHYLVTHLAQLQRAIADGCDVRGYMYWSLHDNFEWREGFAKKFGLLEVDFADPALPRRPRQSAELYREVVAANALTGAIADRHAPGALERWPVPALEGVTTST